MDVTGTPSTPIAMSGCLYRPVLLLLAALWAAPGARADLDRALSLNFRKDTDLRDIVSVIARLGNVNIVLDPKVRSKMSLELKDISAGEALRVVAGINGLEIGRLGNVYIVGSRETIRNAIGRGEVALARLGYAKAEDIASLISKIFKDDLEAIAHPQTNSVILAPR